MIVLFLQEEFSRRLGKSKYVNQLILKGGFLLFSLGAGDTRATMDSDYLMKSLANKKESVESVIQEIIAIDSEGNTIRLPETVSILLEGTTPGNKSVREFYEIVNHKEAFHYIYRLYARAETLTIHVVKDIHSLLFDRLQHDRGSFKSNQNAMVGAEFQTASPEETPILMNQWVENTNDQLEHAKATEDRLSILAESHIIFERIHPFSDGNGRTGRMILMYHSLLECGVPMVINNNNRALYTEALANQDIDTLSDIFQDSILYEKERIEYFKQ